MDVSQVLKDLDVLTPPPINWSALMHRKRPRFDDEAGSFTSSSLSATAPCPNLIPDNDAVLQRMVEVVGPILRTGECDASSIRPPRSENNNKSSKAAAVSPGSSNHTTDAADAAPAPPSFAPLDYNKSLDIIRGNAKRSFVECVSTLSDAQHRVYAPFVASFLQGLSTTRLTEQEALLDILDREQAQFMQKWREYVISCPRCLNEPTKEAHAGPCYNHNYVPESLMKSGVLESKAKLLNSLLGPHARPDGPSPLMVSLQRTQETKPMHPRACMLIGAREVAPPRCSSDQDGALHAFPPEHQLSFPASTISSLARIRSDGWWRELRASVKEDKSGGGVTISLDALIAVASTLSFASEGPEEVSMHLSYSADASGNRLFIGDVLPSEATRRTEVLRAAYHCAVAEDEALPLASRSQHEALFQLPLAVSPTSVRLVVSQLFSSDVTERLIVPLVKLHYLRKPDGSGPTALAGMLEEYAKAELLRMYLTLALLPQVQLAVHHVDAFSGVLLNVEVFTPTTFSSSVWTPGDPECTFAWTIALKALQQLHRTLGESNCAAGRATAEGVVTVRRGGSVTVFDSKGSPPAWKAAFEPATESTAARDYLPPALWPAPARVPFTFPPSAEGKVTAAATSTVVHRGKLIGKALLVHTKRDTNK